MSARFGELNELNLLSLQAFIMADGSDGIRTKGLREVLRSIELQVRGTDPVSLVNVGFRECFEE